MIVDDTVAAMPDDEILWQIDLIEENIAVCGRRSSYATRNRPLLKAMIVEADKRGLVVP